MRRSNTWLLLILIIAVTAGILYIFHSEGKNAAEQDRAPDTATATATPTPTATPQPTAAPTATPVMTAVPTSVPTAVPTATPTPVPTATPYVDHTASGTFRSDTGAWINIVAKWETVEEDGKVRLKIDAYVESYSLNYTSYLPDNVVFNVDGTTYRASHDPIYVADNGKTETLIASKTVDIPTGTDIKVEVTWFCTGLTYGNRQLDSITAGDTIHIP